MNTSKKISDAFYHNQRLLNGKFRIEELNLAAPPRIREVDIDTIEEIIKIVPKDANYPHKSQLDIMQHLDIYNKVLERVWNHAKNNQNITKEDKDFQSIQEEDQFDKIKKQNKEKEKEKQEEEEDDEYQIPELSFNLSQK